MTDTNDLPPLPDGWEWKRDIPVTMARSIDTVVHMCHGILWVTTTNVADGFAATIVPPEVILAVLRANGYSFTS